MGAGRWVVSAACTASRVGSGMLFAEDLGRRAVQGGRDVARGAVEVHRVGLSGRHRLAGGQGGDRSPEAPGIVGGDLYHSDDDRERALADLDLAFGRFRADVEPRATAIDAPPARVQWWRADVEPSLSDWSLFRRHQASWIHRVATEWSTYEAWLILLRGMRTAARTQGLVLSSPEPDRLPATALERGRLGTGSGIEAAWTIGRVLLYTAIGLAGTASIYTVWRDLRASTSKEQTP